MSKWIKDIDYGMVMLRCENCSGRVIFDHYSRAVGLKGYDYCPYCGTQMQRPKLIADQIKKIETDCSWK